MKKRIKIFIAVVLVGVLAISLWGCEKDKDEIQFKDAGDLFHL